MTERRGLATLEAQETVESLRDRLSQQERRFQLLDNQMHVLERERQKLAAILHHADAGFVVFDVEGRVTWTNRQFVRAFGNDCHPASFLRTACHQAICAQAARCEGCPLARTLASGDVAHHELEMPLDGNMRNVYLSTMPIKTMTGEVVEVMLMLQDLSDLEVLRRSKAGARGSDVGRPGGAPG